MLAWIVERLMLVRPNEHRSTLVSFAIAFLLMASYFVLRPARERPSLFHTPTNN